MRYEEQKKKRMELNTLMASQDSFYQAFGVLDDGVYAEGAIPKKYKELMGLAISVATRCDECITYHIGGCVDSSVQKAEIMEAIKIGVIAGGSITFPNARHAFATLKEIDII